jgi:thiamine biosynthesis protein ThiI
MKKALVLISGGIDSPVAAHILQQQGFNVTGIHFSQTPFTDNGPEKKSVAACKKLKIKKLIVVQAGSAFQELATKCSHEFYFVLMKRMMLRVSAEIAKKEKIDFIATGEALAQVSSQTLKNLYAIDEASPIQVIRPLLTYDKNEIIKIAYDIDTFTLSCGPEVCDVLGPKHPKTRAKLDDVLYEEKKIDVNLLAKEIIKTKEEKIKK